MAKALPIPKKPRSMQIGDKEADVLNTKGSSAVYHKARVAKLKAEAIKQNPQSVMDYIFGKTEENPLKDIK